MISVCDKCTRECKYKNRNPFSCENSDRKVRKMENDRFRFQNTKKDKINTENWRF